MSKSGKTLWRLGVWNGCGIGKKRKKKKVTLCSAMVCVDGGDLTEFGMEFVVLAVVFDSCTLVTHGRKRG